MKEETTETAPEKTRSHKLWCIAAVVFTLGAWALLMFVNGYAALASGIAALAVSISACVLCTGGSRRIAIACIVASSVLVTVISAFLIGIRVALG